MNGLAPKGEIVIVDFGDFAGCPSWFARGMRAFLGSYRVRPLDAAALEAHGARVSHGPFNYYVRARIAAPC